MVGAFDAKGSGEVISTGRGRTIRLWVEEERKRAMFPPGRTCSSRKNACFTARLDRARDCQEIQPDEDLLARRSFGELRFRCVIGLAGWSGAGKTTLLDAG